MIKRQQKANFRDMGLCGLFVRAWVYGIGYKFIDKLSFEKTITENANSSKRLHGFSHFELYFGRLMPKSHNNFG